MANFLLLLLVLLFVLFKVVLFAMFFVLFVFGFYPWMYYLVVSWGIIAYTEKIIILFKLDDIKIGVKGLYWLIKKEKEQAH